MLWSVTVCFEAFRKYTNLDPSSPEGQVLMGQHFISQSVPDISRKLWKLQMGPPTPMAQLIDTALLVFNNQYLEERKEQIQHRKKGEERQAKLIVQLLVVPLVVSSHFKVSQESHKKVQGKMIKHTLSVNALDTGQGIALCHPQGHVPCAKVQTPISDTVVQTVYIPRVENDKVVLSYIFNYTEKLKEIIKLVIHFTHLDNIFLALFLQN